MPLKTFKTEVAGKEITVEIGKLAPQANGACTVRIGDTVVLGTAVMSKDTRPGTDFLPVMVDYEERLYASGKIKGSRFIKREGKPTDEAILTSRLIDRGIRPLFDKNIRNDIQLVLTVLSYDSENYADIAAILAASIALSISDIPFAGPMSGVRIGTNTESDKLLVNPTHSDMEKQTMDLVVSGKDDRILMIEAGASEIPDEKMMEAVKEANENIKKLNAFQQEIIDFVKPVKTEPIKAELSDDLKKEIKEIVGDRLEKLVAAPGKGERSEETAKITEEVIAKLKESSAAEGLEEKLSQVNEIVTKIWENALRNHILTKKTRINGRKLDEVRPLEIEVGLFPRTHGSGFFQRGETQGITLCTLGAPGMEQILDGMEEERKKRYMHHYNFPPYSVGETAPLRGPGRREIGHGALAERALRAVLPTKEDFPYTIRLVSEIMASAGSTSMAATCGSSLSFMGGGVSN